MSFTKFKFKFSLDYMIKPAAQSVTDTAGFV